MPPNGTQEDENHGHIDKAMGINIEEEEPTEEYKRYQTMELQFSERETIRNAQMAASGRYETMKPPQILEDEQNKDQKVLALTIFSKHSNLVSNTAKSRDCVFRGEFSNKPTSAFDTVSHLSSANRMGVPGLKFFGSKS